METLQNILRGNINGKKYLLVLDDVWNEDSQNWHNLRNLLLGGARGSWIVITTRSRRIAKITGTVSPHVLEGLSKCQSWSLLKKKAFDDESHESNGSHFEAIGMEIVEKCKGVPLALTVIGSLLGEGTESLLGKGTEEHWLKVRNNFINHITRPESGIMPILKLSYDHLKPHLKQCFAYCSLIPKDTEFEVKDLIMDWMALGFIQPRSRDEDLEDTGHGFFMNLLWRSFFQVAKEDDSGNVKSFTMHDLMHELACSVAGNECCIASLEAENVDERTRHVLFEDELDYSWEIPSALLKAKRVRTFSLISGGYLNQSNCNVLTTNFKYLRSLNLSYVGIERLPHSIGKLKHLRALFLNGNKNIKKLPSSLSRLQNLQTLSLSYCFGLEKLPSKTTRLVNLRYLYIDGCYSLAYMPRGLGQLICLQTLNQFVVGKRGKEVGKLRDLNGLNNLKGEIYISSLQNAIPEPGSSYLKEKLNLKSLALRWDRVDDASNVKYEKVFEGLQPHPNQEKLEVYGYPGSKISSWLSSITNLTLLILEDCVECKHLPPLHQLFSLKFLRLSGLKALENLSEIEKQKELSSSKSTKFFPSLEELDLKNCPNLKGWWRSDVDEASNAQLPCFPCLSDLSIESCPLNLISIPLYPSVTTLYLKRTSWKQLQQILKLKMTTSEETSSSSSSSLFPPFSKLTKLRLEEMEDIDSLPEEFLQNLTSLQSLSIYRCSNLTSMPKGMQCLTTLKELDIWRCPQLSERCERGIGVDWPNIAHIRNIRIGTI